MPRLDDGMEIGRIGGGSFTFSGARLERLGATEYTLVTIAVDETGSVHGFDKDLVKAVKTAVDACQKSPRAENLLLRVIKFSTDVGGVEELHGFKPLADIDVADYDNFYPGGMTPLFDAVYSGVGATNAYAQKLYDDDFFANGIVFVITDGWDNASTATPKMIKDEIEKAVRGEQVESLITVLVGINAGSASAALDDFRQEAGLDQYIDVGDVTKGKLAKLADFVSQSVSSQSQALGTGGPSQNISATI